MQSFANMQKITGQLWNRSSKWDRNYRTSWLLEVQPDRITCLNLQISIVLGSALCICKDADAKPYVYFHDIRHRSSPYTSQRITDRIHERRRWGMAHEKKPRSRWRREGTVERDRIRILAWILFCSFSNGIRSSAGRNMRMFKQGNSDMRFSDWLFISLFRALKQLYSWHIQASSACCSRTIQENAVRARYIEKTAIYPQKIWWKSVRAFIKEDRFK